MKKFDKSAFEASFTKSLELLTASERVTKHELKVLSRTVLEALHETGNVGYVNKLITILTPMNRKTAILYFQSFSGFKFDKTEGVFTGKDRKHYENTMRAAYDFLNDPHNNIWTWADRNVKVETKEFSLDGFKKYVHNSIAKADVAGISHIDLLKAVFAAGIEPECIIEAMDSLGYDVEVNEEVLQTPAQQVGEALF